MNAISEISYTPLPKWCPPVSIIDVKKCTDEISLGNNIWTIENSHALILEWTIWWTIPLIFNDIIQARTDRWLPTFVVGAWYYISNWTDAEIYQNHKEAEAVGVISLTKLNLNQIEELAVFIMEKINWGKLWDELVRSVQDFNDVHPEVTSTMEATERDMIGLLEWSQEENERQIRLLLGWNI